MKLTVSALITCTTSLIVTWLITPLAVAQSFKFEQLLQLAMQQNLTMQIQQKQQDAILASESAAFKGLLPSARLASGASRTIHNSTDPNSENSSYSTSITLSQPLYQPALWSSWRKSELNVQRTQQGTQRQRQQLIFDVKSAWYQLLEERALNQQAEDALARLMLHQKNAKAFFNEGKIWRNDVLQAGVRVAGGRQTLLAANNRLTLAKSSINRLINRSLTAPMTALGQLTFTDFQQDFQIALEQAMENRLDLKQAGIDIELAKRDKRIVEAKREPTVNFTIRSGATSLKLDHSDPATDTVASINLTWDFWQWGQTNDEVYQSDVELQIAQLNFQQQQQTVYLEVQQAYLAVIEAKQSLKLAEQSLEQAKENYRVSEIRYQEQLGSASDVLDAQDLLTQTQTDQVSSLARYLTAIAQLNLAVGQD